MAKGKRPEWVSHIHNIARAVEDEGDRVYFGSTNDADLLKEIAASLDEAEIPERYFRRPDFHRHNKELRRRIAELEAEVTSLKGLQDGEG